MIKAVVTNWEWKRLFVINFPSGTTVLECGELDMIWIEETVVKMDRSRNQHHVNIIVTIVTVKIYHYSLIHKSLKMIVDRPVWVDSFKACDWSVVICSCLLLSLIHTSTWWLLFQRRNFSSLSPLREIMTKLSCLFTYSFQICKEMVVCWLLLWP